MIKALLFATIGLLVTPFAAYAQIPVIDSTSIGQAIKDTVQTIQEAQRIEQAAITTFQQLERAVDPNSLAQQLMTNLNPMPGMGNISSMITGGAGIGQILNLANQFKNSNTIYSPNTLNGADFVANLLQRQGNSWSNTQGMAAQTIEDAQARIAALQSIQSDLSNVTSESDLTAINGRLAGEQSKLAALQIQMQGISTMATVQNQQYELQQMQVQRRSADALSAYFGGNNNNATDTGPQIMATTVDVPNFNALNN